MAWYESTPTIINQDGVTTIINATDEIVDALMAARSGVAAWVALSKKTGEPIMIPTRAAAVAMLRGAAAAEIAVAGLRPETTAITNEADADRVIPPAEYSKLAKLWAAIIVETGDAEQ